MEIAIEGGTLKGGRRNLVAEFENKVMDYSTTQLVWQWHARFGGTFLNSHMVFESRINSQLLSTY